MSTLKTLHTTEVQTGDEHKTTEGEGHDEANQSIAESQTAIVQILFAVQYRYNQKDRNDNMYSKISYYLHN